MANDENLISADKRSKEEVKKMGAKGGKASAKSRRKKASIRKALDTVLTSKVPDDKLAKQLEQLGYDNSMELAMVFSMVRKAVSGDVRAFEAVTRITNTKDEHDIKEQKTRIKLMNLEIEERKNNSNKEQSVEDKLSDYFDKLEGAIDDIT